MTDWSCLLTLELPVSVCGTVDELSLYTTELRELDLSCILLSSWADVAIALRASPQLTSLNISRNRFSPASLAQALPLLASQTFPLLKILAINDCKPQWEEVNALLACLPSLHELYLSGNGISTVELASSSSSSLTVTTTTTTAAAAAAANGDSPGILESLVTLQLNNNALEDWQEVWKLATLPALQNLYLSGNPLTRVAYTIPSGLEQSHLEMIAAPMSPQGSRPSSPSRFPPAASARAQRAGLDGESSTEDLAATTAASPVIATPALRYLPFPTLRRLVVTSTNLDGWESVDALSLFPKLREVKLQEIEAFKAFSESQKRQLMIARLGKIRVLNGSEITRKEREGAERLFLRHHKHDATRPAVYDQLLAKHGEVPDLVDIDLSAPQTVLIKVICDEAGAFHRVSGLRLKVTSSITQLREEIAAQVFQGRVPAQELKLFYADPAMVAERGREEMVYWDRPFYYYRPSDADMIFVERRGSRN